MKPIPDYRRYFATDAGHIYSDKTEVFLSERINHRGYPKVNLHANGLKKSVFVHRLVAAAYHGVCPVGMQVNHIDHDKANNRPENLEYVTPSANRRAYKAKAATVARPERKTNRGPKPKPVLAEKDGRIMRFETVRDAGLHGFSPAGISQCLNGKIKTHRGWAFREDIYA